MPRRMLYANKFFHPAICLALFVSIISAKMPLTLPQNAILYPSIVLRNAPDGTSPLSGTIDFENHPINHRPRLIKTTTSPGLKWVRTSTTWYKFSATAGGWYLHKRDTNLYNSEGKCICTKSSRVQNGWTRESINFIDTVISSGPLFFESRSLPINNGIVDSANGARRVQLFDDTQNVLVKAQYGWYAGKWKEIYLDSLQLAATAPISEVSIDYYLYRYPPYLVSRRYYNFEGESGRLINFDFETKIDAESRDSSFVILREFNYRENETDTEKIVRSLLPNGKLFDSTVAEDSLGNWVPKTRSTQGFDVDSNYTHKTEDFRNGDWVPSYLITTNKFGGNYYSAWNRHRNQWDYVGFQFIDAHRNDTLGGAVEWDSINNHWDTTNLVRYTNVYDDYGNLKIQVTARKEGTKALTKEDSTIYTYAQINILPVRTQGMPQKSKLIVTQSRSALRFFALEITGIRIYTIAGRLAYSADQPSAPGMTLHSKNLPLLSIAGIYFAKVMTPKYVITRQFTICN
jgi:hypothetical protein